jgi:TonB family protein
MQPFQRRAFFHSFAALLVMALWSQEANAEYSATVDVKFTVAANGQLLSKELLTASHYPDFDRQSLDAVSSAAPYLPFPVSAPLYSSFVARFVHSPTTGDHCTILPAPPSTANASIELPKPMFDCACLKASERELKRNWYPPKDGKGGVVSFFVGEDGHASKIKLVSSSGIEICDRAATEAVEKSIFRGNPIGVETEVQWKFDYLGPVIIRFHSPEDLKFVPVSSEYGSGHPDCFESYTKLSNDGVELLLRGDTAGALKLFEQAHQSNPDYFPAIYNLNLVNAMIKK